MAEEKKKILVAEDEKPLRMALSDRLREEPEFDIDEASDGLEAFEKISSGPYDLVLLDIAMPQKNGLTIYQEMKESDWGKDIDVMFLTNSTSLNEVAFAQKFGPVDYLVKSDWDLEDIIVKIKEKFQ